MDRNDKRVIIDFIKKAEKGFINLLDQGKSVKTYGYISDIAEMFFNIIQHGKKTTYNTVGKNYMSILNLAKLVSKQFDGSRVVLPVKKENKKSIHISSDHQNSIISSQRYCEEFGKKSFVSINDGIKKLIQYLSF
jgi:nucleoside-diphosphate-sugar epimerase